VGAYQEDGSATTVNGPDDNLAGNSGAAYVFRRTGVVWVQEAYLKAETGDIDDLFGVDVDVDGDVIVVGANAEDGSARIVNDPEDDDAGAAGAAYVFRRTAGVWAQEAYLKAWNADAGDRFGEAVAIEGDRILVGARFEEGLSPGVNGPDGNGGVEVGAAYTFRRSGGIWQPEAYLKAAVPDLSEFFGGAVALDADTVVVGAFGESGDGLDVDPPDTDNLPVAGAAYVFR